MRIEPEIKAAAGIIAFLTVFFLLNPTHKSFLRQVEISGILSVTLLTFLVSKKLNPHLRYKITLFVTLISAMLIGYVIREEFPPLKYSFIFLMLLLLVIISPLLLKLVRFEHKQELSAGDLLKIVLLAVIITIYAVGIALISYWF